MGTDSMHTFEKRLNGSLFPRFITVRAIHVIPIFLAAPKVSRFFPS